MNITKGFKRIQQLVLPARAGFEPEECASMFQEIDRDGSGEVSFQEFEAW